MYEALLQAYRETEYRVFNDSHIVLLIDQFNKASDALLVDRDVTTAAFITAWNPHSKPVSKSENDIAQARLQSEVMSLELDYLPGEGVGRDGIWPPEPSLLVLGISFDRAAKLSKTFKQNAFVWLNLGKGPELVMTHA